MSYKNVIAAWQDIELTVQEIASVRAIVAGAFKRAGGKGALPSVVSCKSILKGKIAVDAATFTAGNVQEAPAQIMAKPLSKLAEPANNGAQDTGLAEKLATIEKALAMLLTQGSAPSHAPSAMLAPAQKNTKARKAA